MSYVQLIKPGYGTYFFIYLETTEVLDVFKFPKYTATFEVF
jgi:hypothetical protein